jgi:[protein-PII] uridylyltransferase
MNETFSLQKKENDLKLHNQFKSWLTRERGRQVKGIGHFLEMKSNLSDLILQEIWLDLDLAKVSGLGLFSVGGYGRGELHPFSDIDLLILSKKTLSKQEQLAVTKFISLLWDIGFDVGHSVRTLNDSKAQARLDIRTMTNMLESRLISGDKDMELKLFKLLKIKSLWPNKKFFKAKHDEQIERHTKFYNTEYNLEPDIKSSPGGLRDIHTIDWLLLNYSRNLQKESFDLSNIITAFERNELKKAKYWLWTIRYLLHLKANREEDRLLFEYQIAIAKKLFPTITNPNAAAEKLMHRYYRSALTISEINSTVIQSIKENLFKAKSNKKKRIDNNFYQKNNLIGLQHSNGFKKNSSLLLDLFVKLTEHPELEGIESQTLRFLKEDRDLIDAEFRKKKKNINLFLKLIKSKRLMVTQLENMKELGILGRYLPEFGRITGQMQYDLFHIYTVDAHTLQVLRNMRRMLLGTSQELFPLASQIILTLPKIEVLYIAGLYHDIGKGRGKDHSTLGMTIVRRFCKNHNFNDVDRKLIEWLVINHLMMSKRSQKEDLSDPSTIRNFAEVVQSQKNLDYLYCLTVADVSATNPNLWNSWNASLLGDLYTKTTNFLNQDAEKSKLTNLKLAKQTILQNQKIAESELNTLWDNFYSNYFESFEAEELVDHALILLKGKDSTKVKLFKDKNGTTTLIIHTKDRPNVFAATIGILDSEDINFLEAKIFGMKNGYCFDCLKISDKNGSAISERTEKAVKIITKLSESLDQEDLIPKLVKKRLPTHLKHFNLKTSINVKHDMTNRWTQIDLRTKDRPGILANVSRVFVSHNAVIKKARISTYGERAEDSFCISSVEDTPFLKKKELNQLITDLKESLKI